jgi:hypothetical protein
MDDLAHDFPMDDWLREFLMELSTLTETERLAVLVKLREIAARD